MQLFVFEQIIFEESVHPQVLCPCDGMKKHSGMILNYSAFRKKIQKIVTVNSRTSGKYLQASAGILEYEYYCRVFR